MKPDLRLGRYQDVLADVEVDAVICDPPFGARTHEGYNAAYPTDGSLCNAIAYTSWRPSDVDVFVAHWNQRCAGWIVAITSDDLIPAWRDAYMRHGRCDFAPVPCVTIGSSIRLAGDGPSSWTVYAMVARPRTTEFAKWGTLPGAYVSNRPSDWQFGGGGGRGKPLDLMRKIVSDYSRPGDLVCDPTAGYGSTLAAALQKGRRAIGAECDPEVYAEAQRRLAGVQYVDLFDKWAKAKQAKLVF